MCCTYKVSPGQKGLQFSIFYRLVGGRVHRDSTRQEALTSSAAISMIKPLAYLIKGGPSEPLKVLVRRHRSPSSPQPRHTASWVGRKLRVIKKKGTPREQALDDEVSHR